MSTPYNTWTCREAMHPERSLVESLIGFLSFHSSPPAVILQQMQLSMQQDQQIMPLQTNMAPARSTSAQQHYMHQVGHACTKRPQMNLCNFDACGSICSTGQCRKVLLLYGSNFHNIELF